VTAGPDPAASPGDTGADPHCAGEVCITCSDAAVAVRVRALLPDGFAEVETAAGVEEVSVALVDARPGDFVLVHASEAIAVQQDDASGPASGR
jgi:hydrogenase maturation factor